MIQIVQGFEVKTREAIDNRLVLSKQEMFGTNDNQMPVKYFAVCSDDGYLYVYNKDSAIISSETGKFRKYSYCKIESISINNIPLTISDLNVDIPLASDGVFGVSKAGKGIAAIDGVYSIDFSTVDQRSIPINKVDWENAIIVKGYYYQDEFYVNATHTEKYVPYEYKLYVDIPSSIIYIYNGTDFIPSVRNSPNATSELAGIMKLYQETGQNIDGTISQKIITDSINERFKVTDDAANEMITFLNN